MSRNYALENYEKSDIIRKYDFFYFRPLSTTNSVQSTTYENVTLE